MALRLIQIKLPALDDDRLQEMLAGHTFVNTWLAREDEERLMLQLIAPAEACEAIMDNFDRRFHDAPGFHMLLLPVEAMLPRPLEEQAPPDAQPTAEADADADADTDANNRHRVSREELYAEVNEGLKIGPVFLAMTILSSIVAAIGLLRDDLAVIIGAMVIAPLLTPNVGLSLATALGDFKLARNALKTNMTGVLISFFLAICIGIVFQVSPETPAIVARTAMGPSDIILALAAGSAGTLAFTSGVPGALIGVMVAVALMPPLVTCGMLLGEGEWLLSSGAFLLVAANVICVNIAGVATFALQGVRPRTWWEAEKAKKATIKATVIHVALLMALIAILIIRYRIT